jgi:hypothetical protein
LVYPVLAVGDVCSVEGDVAEQVKPMTKEEEERSHRGFLPQGGMPSEEVAVAFNFPQAVNAALLLRLGKPELASAVWEASGKSARFPECKAPTEGEQIYKRMAMMWLFSIYERGICAWIRGDDNLALASMREVTRAAPEIRKTYKEKYGAAKPRFPGDDPFGFLDMSPTYVADMERHHKEPPRKSALELGRDHFAYEQAWIKALIEDLENVYAPQDGQPGWVRLDQNPTVQALVREGNAAVGPLLECVEHDSRLTRSVFFWRDFSPERTLVGVNEAAYTALTGILKTQFFNQISTGQDLTNSGPETRAKVVAAMRAYWKQREGKPVEGQWFTTLADDKATPEEWVTAAENIVKSGESLRGKTKPSVTELMKKGIECLSKATIKPSWRPPPGAELADALLTWDGTGEAEYVRGVCNGMAGRYAAQKYISPSDTEGLLNLAEHVLAEGVDFHLYRKVEAAPGEIVKEKGSGWVEQAAKAGIGRFDLPAPTRKLVPGDVVEVMSCKLEDFYDLKTAGKYLIEMTFDPAKVKFTGGTYEYIGFQIE